MDLGGGALFVAIRLTGHPLGATGSIDEHQGWVYAWDGEAVTKVITIGDPAQARAAEERMAHERG